MTIYDRRRLRQVTLLTSGTQSEPFGPPLIGALLRDAAGRPCSGACSSGCTSAASTTSTRRTSTVFQYPGPQGTRPSELAARLRISKQALNYLLGELERLGYLERRPDPDDLRSKRIALTARGTSAIRVIREAVGEMEASWAQQLGPKRFAQLQNLLLDLNRPTSASGDAAPA